MILVIFLKACNFLTSAGKPIKHADIIETVLSLPVFHQGGHLLKKTRAHAREDTEEAAGNARADRAAKKAALEQVPIRVLTLVGKQPTPVSMAILISLQKKPPHRSVRSGGRKVQHRM